MRMVSLLARLSLCPMALSACGPVEDQPQDRPADVAEEALRAGHPGNFQGVEYFGDGCGDSAGTGISPDGQAVTSLFSGFVASTGPGSGEGSERRSCLMQVRVSVPAGWSYTLATADVRGFVGLEAGVSGERRSQYILPGNQPHPSRGNSWPASGVNENFNTGDLGPKSKLGWSPCGKGGLAWIATELSVDGADRPDATGQVAVDSIDLSLGWKRCQ